MDIYFFGTFNCKADAKGRIMLPVALRNQMTPILNEGFFIKKSYYNECLELYPAQEWYKIMAEMDQNNRFDEESQLFQRIFMDGLRPVEVDGTGRLLLAKDVISLAGITKEVKIVPMRKHLEIWDVKEYEATISISKEEKKNLVKRVMLNKKDDKDVS
ncbi:MULTISPECIES: division/cell wall cluster transcriptional repressor MraZ [Maribacter]|uniref:Transcriptional regulator MraZ n=2 Tax=Maribacter TaxID=252356 RepID=A0A1H4JG36_9FLAO|nr:MULTISPECIES: division/cell wall cluster transcriptional repressor MraZ [Maribacter]HAI39386.1 division/cell wall cluster transcriptional repressor MraZ [Maribacter sp.]MBU2899557.1 division/cell wall cluster transcriptional repressor MraZ [Maribacter dokdonensis]MDP2527617.1 division/cell wall cluster transcriptional repressor MraZ [Maribacter dokdonensis]PHN92032.1 division/cell wall cluster transcriptional repressor MraZ [Maribacter sp. 6B07]CAG2533906.1 MraZ protein [Maribacter dokdonen